VPTRRYVGAPQKVGGNHVSEESTAASMSPEERMSLRRQVSEQAVLMAINSRWEEAAAVNTELLRLFGEEPDALNRLGKALSELGQSKKALNAYQRAAEMEPNNSIARRNIERLSALGDENSADQPASQLDTSLFIEETGKAGSAVLQAVDEPAAAHLDAGDLVNLEIQGKAVNVHRNNGEYVGMVEPKVGLRLVRMISGGNQYSAAVLSVGGPYVRIILRETFQDPSQAGNVSFPPGKLSDVRAFTRRSLVSEKPEPPLDSDADDEPQDESTEGWTTTDDEGAVEEKAGDESADPNGNDDDEDELD